MAGTAVGTTAGVGAGPGSSLAVRPMVTADAMCGDWSRLPGVPAGGSSMAAIEPRSLGKWPPAAKAGGACRFQFAGTWMFSCNFYDKPMQLTPERKPFQPRRLGSASIDCDQRANVMNSRINDDSEQIDRKTSRSICDAVGQQLQQHLRPVREMPSDLEHLMDELRRRDTNSRWMTTN